MKTIKQNFQLFFGVFIMLFFASLAFFLLKNAKDTFFISKIAKTLGEKDTLFLLGKLKTFSIGFSLFFGLFLLFFTRNGKIQRAFFLFYPITIIFYLAIFGAHFADLVLLQNKVIASILYVVSTISMTFSLALIWGFANQNYTFKSAALHYPILMLLTTTPATFLANAILRNAHLMQTDFSVHTLIIIAYLIILGIYFLLTKTDLGQKEMELKVSWVYWVAIAVFVFSLPFAKTFLEILFKLKVKLLFPKVHDYLSLMMTFSAFKIRYDLFISFLAILLGLLIYFMGSRILAKIGATLIVGLIILGIFIVYRLASPTLEKEEISSAIYLLAFYASVSMLFLHLIKELCFFAIQRKNRFTAKLAIDYMLTPISLMFASRLFYAIQYKKIPKIDPITIYFILFFIAMIAAMWGVFIIHQNLKKGLTSEK